jgi:hypothetical protein
MTRKMVLSSGGFLLLILFVSALAYGRWALTLGYFWDDFPIRWILHEYGLPGLQRYYSIDRPFMAWIYGITTTFIDFTPLSSQIFALVWRAISAAALWGLLRQVWPKRADLAGWSALLFTVYPGFSQHYISFVYGHYYLLVAAFFGSLSLTILAVRNPRRFWLYTAGALVLSAINLFCWEYYFLLDVLRPLLVWWVLGEQHLSRKVRLRRILTIWLPYLAVFLAAVYWRTSVLGYQTYQPVFFSELRTAPWDTLLHLLQRVFTDIWRTTGLAWWKSVQTLIENGIGNGSYLGVVGLGAAATAIYFYFQPAPNRSQDFWAIFVTSLAALFLAGGPFWLISIDISLNFSNDRFVLPFLLGGSLITATLASLLPRGFHLPVLVVLVGLSAAQQYHNGYAYRSDWEQARRLFWELSMRVPGLEPHTTLLMNDDAFTYYTDISLSAPLNWLYRPEPAGKMDFMLLYPSIRLGGKIPDLTPGRTIEVDYRSDYFIGSTSQVVVVVYRPPGCFRIVDPEVEVENNAVPEILRKALPLSDERWILPEPTGRIPEDIIGRPPADTWCEVYERADLARQLQDWPAVIQGWERAQASDLEPADPIELLPFVEAYAHAGDWKSALVLSHQAAQPGSQYPSMLCRLWARIERETVVEPEQEEAIRQVRAEFNCE